MTQKAKPSFSNLIRGAWQATADERPRFVLFTIFFVFAYTLDLMVPWAIGYTLGVFVEGGITEESFRKGLMGIAVYTLLRLGYTIFHHIARWIQNRVAYSARMNIMSRIFDSLLRFPLRWHVAHHSGESLSKLHRSTGAIDHMVGTYVWQMIEGSVKIIAAPLLIFALDFWVATNVLIMASLTVVAVVIFNKPLTVRIRRNNIFGDKLNRICVDYLVNIVTVKTLGVEEAAKKYLRQQKPEGLRLSQSISAFMELKWGATGIGYVLVICTSLLIHFYGHRSTSTAINVAEVYVLLNYLDRIFQAIGSFTGFYSGLVEGATAYEDASKIFDEAATLPEKPPPSALSENWKTMHIRKIDFTYIPGEKVGLNNVRFELNRGEKIALVGQSGSGKSTLLKVFGGLIAPDGCLISTDTQPEISIDDLVPHCLLIPQEPEIFSESVRYNLTMGEEFDPKEISFFVSLCKLDMLIGRLPNGLESSLAEKGLNLSVGEKQRIGLARGLLRAGKKEIVLLDEPTSSLDVKNEKEIFLGLLYHFSGRTIISSVHRLNLVPLFDKLIFMSQSSVLEVGTFSELIEQRGHFYRVWDDYQRNIKANPAHQSAASLDI